MRGLGSGGGWLGHGWVVDSPGTGIHAWRGSAKELQDENRRLKKMYADAQLSAELLKEALSKKW